MTNAISLIDDVDYLQRATDVVTKVCAVIPEIAESVADLPECITKATQRDGLPIAARRGEESR